jgi:ABC-type ATPase with predicted acetyltransferase domain
MNNCSECGRPLAQGENDLCPACKSDKSHKKKGWVKKIGGAVVAAGVIVIAILKGGKNS